MAGPRGLSYKAPDGEGTPGPRSRRRERDWVQEEMEEPNSQYQKQYITYLQRQVST